ncbi:hypothetical protein [Candidatus Accumulibacter sp. ACC005]|uniref:SLOG domain-containing protein n=1 Tax=Candidatus Accumulibacter sp. ACC005 TaxID=2823331 RepID=UPI0025BEF824|nr:hypothetical protein [Candidatus Accumulibacter sp. ACC005]
MSAIFLSASVPLVGRGNYHETADPFLIQCAVRELVMAVIKTQQIIWGGHPAITPMIWSICEDLGIDYAKSVVLYQSRFFEDRFPEENKNFGNVVFVDAVPNDREASLLRMRKAMLSRSDLTAAVFIGGMEGVEAEFELFGSFHPGAKTLAVAAPGGAARQLAERIGISNESVLSSVDFARLFYSELLPSPKQDPTTHQSTNDNR